MKCVLCGCPSIDVVDHSNEDRQEKLLHVTSDVNGISDYWQRLNICPECGVNRDEHPGPSECDRCQTAWEDEVDRLWWEYLPQWLAEADSPEREEGEANV